MIPPMHLAQWRTKAPWGPDSQIEQDLILTKALIQIYSDTYLKDAFALRGGTAMQKLFFEHPTRYSEDIDLVQVRQEPIGNAIDAIRKLLDPWLGEPRRDRKQSRVTLLYRFESEMPPIQRMRLKIEVNTGEHLVVLGKVRHLLRCESDWFSGSAEILTYEIEELVGTKLRALYQRKKGRDLYDLSLCLDHFKNLDLSKIILCFLKYMEHGKTTVSRTEFEANLSEKLRDRAFKGDVQILLSPNSPAFDFAEEGERVKVELLSRLP